MSAQPAALPALAADPRLIIPLDVPTRADAESLIAKLGDSIAFYKIGLQLLATGGMGLAHDLKRAGHQIFLDWKLHDIGTTVEKAAAAIAATGDCDVLTVHAEPQVMAAAVRGRAGAKGVKIVGVTVLTSLDDDALTELGYGLKVSALVERRIRQAIDAGVGRSVASPHEAALARQDRRAGFPGPSRRGPPCLGPRPTIRPAQRRLRRPRPRAPATWSAAGRSPRPSIRAPRPFPSSRRWPGSDPAYLQPQP